MKKKIVLEWDSEVIEAVEKWAKGVKVDLDVFIEALILDKLAYLSAKFHAEGPQPLTFNELAYDDKNQLMRGKDLYTLRHGEYLKMFEVVKGNLGKEEEKH